MVFHAAQSPRKPKSISLDEVKFAMYVTSRACAASLIWLFALT